MNLCSHEESERSVRLESVESLLQLSQPGRSQMNVLKEKPATSLRRRSKGLRERVTVGREIKDHSPSQPARILRLIR